MGQLRTMSFGGGVQSTAMLVLAAQGVIDYKIALFCNVGDDSEHPDTLRYVREVAMPYAAANGIALHELKRTRRDGSTETLMERINRSERSITIPMRLGDGAGFMNRTCTADFKSKVISRWLRLHGATKGNPASVAIGISLDELHRARTTSREPLQAVDYPLITRRLTRDACAHLIRQVLPVPPKSSCWYCPMHNIASWQELREKHPDLYAKAVALEQQLSNRMERLNRPRGYLSGRLVPLDMVTTANTQHRLFDDSELDVCESGFCFT